MIFGGFGPMWVSLALAGCGGGGACGPCRGRGLGAWGVYPAGVFGGALLVVSILGIVYDCHLQPL